MSAGSRNLSCDVVVVGTGLSGGWAMKELAEAGVHVIALDSGPALGSPESLLNANHLPRDRQTSVRRQPVQSRHPTYWIDNPALFVDDIDNPYSSDSEFLWIRSRQVGGRSLLWGGVALRFSDYEFKAAERDCCGSPWPLSHSDLSPYYAKVEGFLGVQGSADGLAQLPDGVFEPPPELTETEVAFKAAVEAKWGARRVIVCRGIPKENSRKASFDRRGSLRTSSGSTIPAALATRRAAVVPNSVVSRLIIDPSDGRVAGVECIDRDSREKFKVMARAVVLAASTIESVRIMLNSGVGNSSGLLGRGICDHIAVTLGGTIPNSKHLPTYPSGGANNICIAKFRNIDERPHDFIRGYGIWGGMQRKENARNRDAFWHLTAALEVLPNEANRVTVVPEAVDAWGIPTARIHLAYGENEKRMKYDAVRAILEMSEEAGLDVRGMDVTLPGQYVHELGGARMGSTPSTSVLNPFNQCWDSENLFVVDGSCFVTAGWQNPSLTIMALAVRACGRIREYLN